ncbi:MAG: DUF819 family protein, partial [Chloroflexi bacterium]|nr:DUF819 family protein [Chloroflexota bacterium]
PGAPASPSVVAGPDAAGTGPNSGSSLRALDVSLLFALGFSLIWLADQLSAAVPAIPSVLWLTTLALGAGQLPAVRRLSGSMLLGTIALHFFFALIGIGSRVSEIVVVGPAVLYLMVIVVGVHGAVIYGVGRLVRTDVATLSVASQAAIGGPTTAMALAMARKWPALMLPGLAAGLIGYAVGNYAGFGIAYLVRSLVG